MLGTTTNKHTNTEQTRLVGCFRNNFSDNPEFQKRNSILADHVLTNATAARMVKDTPAAGPKSAHPFERSLDVDLDLGALAEESFGNGNWNSGLGADICALLERSIGC